MQPMMLHTSGAFKKICIPQNCTEIHFITAHMKLSKSDHWCLVFFVSCGLF